MRSLFFAVPLVLFACSKESTPEPAAAKAPTPAPSAVAAVAPAGDSALEVGKAAPSFDVTASDGTKLSLAALKGKPVVLYFYPKDETPGCTKEACSFRDAWEALSKKGVVLVGISADDDASHRAFAEHHKLPFHLVSDPDGVLAKKFGVSMMGPFMARQTIVIGADGNVKKLYRSVDVSKHAQEIQADLGG
jgi:peroxiredoxin Q/BCP